MKLEFDMLITTYLTLWIRNLGREKKKHFLSNISFLDEFSASTVVSMEMAKNGNLQLLFVLFFEMDIVGYGLSLLLFYYFYFILFFNFRRCIKST